MTWTVTVDPSSTEPRSWPRLRALFAFAGRAKVANISLSYGHHSFETYQNFDSSGIMRHVFEEPQRGIQMGQGRTSQGHPGALYRYGAQHNLNGNIRG
jgi:hypothetical protein